MRHLCRQMLHLVQALLAWGGLLLASSGPAMAAEAGTAIVVFDGSGSMWGRLEGERSSKLVMAREAVRLGLTTLPAGTRVGLMSFGHRRGGDCSDTETLLAPEPLDIERVIAPLERLNPRGRGPITKALREAAESLGSPSAPAVVTLIHDGLDNCQLDPCSAIGELRQAHPRVRVNVLALGLAPEEAQRMSCLATATGGRLYEITTADQAGAAMLTAMRLPGDGPPATTAPARPPETAAATPPPPAPVPAARPGLQLWATLTKGGPVLSLPVRWRIRRAGDKGPPLWEGATPAPLIVLPTGRYEIEAEAGLIAQQAVAEAVEGEPRSLAMVLDAGTLALAETAPALAMLEDVVVTLARVDAKGPGTPQVLSRPEAELALPPGNYLVAATHGAVRIERPVGIEVGQRVSIAAALNLGEVSLSAVPTKDGPALDQVLFTVYEDDPDAPQGRREIARSAAAAPRFKLPAGTYYVIARRGGAEARERFTVNAGERERRELILDAGQVALSVRLPGDRLDGEGPISHRLERLDAQPREVFHASGPAAAFDVAAGRYRLETRIGLANVRAEREIRLRPGEVERIAIEHAAGGVRLRLLERAGAGPVADVMWDVRDHRGQSVWTALGTEARALLLAGRYTVKAEARGIRLERPIEVRAGEERAIDLMER